MTALSAALMASRFSARRCFLAALNSADVARRASARWGWSGGEPADLVGDAQEDVELGGVDALDGLGGGAHGSHRAVPSWSSGLADGQEHESRACGGIARSYLAPAVGP